MVSVLQAYALIHTHVRITCYHHTERGGRQAVVQSAASGGLRANAAAAWGVKAVATLLEIERELDGGVHIFG